MTDQICLFQGSRYQHGSYNNRVYLMKVNPRDAPELIRHLDDLSLKFGYSKIIAKVPARCRELFNTHGYAVEAMIPRFFGGKEECFFMSRFLDPERSRPSDTPGIIDSVLRKCRSLPPCQPHPLPDGYLLRECDVEDAHDISGLYSSVYETYPFPIHDPDFIVRMMNDETRYFGVWHQGKLVAASSAEMDLAEKNVEMTDFATSPDHRGKGLGHRLLAFMEDHVKGVVTVYTISRARSLAINRIFAGAGYVHGGILPDNTNICGSCESMNIWYKSLSGRFPA